MSEDLVARVDKLEGIIDRLAEPRQAAAAAAAESLVGRVSKNTGISPREVERILHELGLPGLQRNLAGSDQPREVVDGGRLVLALVSNRQIIAA